ncbi:transposase [Fusarium oxysporum f. sp. phaseoli]
MPSQENLKAAQAVVLSRARYQKDLSRDASKVSKQPLSLRNAEARHHGSSRATIQRNMRFAQSESAFSNGDITVEWAMEFNQHSWGKSATLQDRQLSFEEYFGCVEHLRKPLEPHISFDVPPKERTPAEKIWRLLVIDGFTGHGAFTFREYCTKFDILIAFLLPHSTHKLQPMDVGVFHRDFAGALMEIFNEGFTRAHIISGFEKSGIFPPTDQPAVSYLLRKQLKSKQAVDPAYASLLPPEGRFSTASDAAKHVGERYHDILSSPTRAGLKHIRNIVNEAMLLEDTIKRYADDRRSRIEKQYNKRKRGKKAKSVGDYLHNVSLQEICDQQESFIAETRSKEGKSQLRTARSIAIREIERLKLEWRDNKEVIVNGILKKLQFMKWLQHTGKDKDYLSMDTQRSKMTELLNEKTNGFMIDTQLPQEVRESISNANFAEKPLNAVDWSALPGSDDSVIFQLTSITSSFKLPISPSTYIFGRLVMHGISKKLKIAPKTGPFRCLTNLCVSRFCAQPNLLGWLAWAPRAHMSQRIEPTSVHGIYKRSFVQWADKSPDTFRIHPTASIEDSLFTVQLNGEYLFN